MENKTLTQTHNNGMRFHYVIKHYLVSEVNRTIQVFYDKQLLAPLSDEVISSEEKSYSLGEEFFQAYENATFSDYIKAGVTDLQQLFRGRAINKISQIENLLNENT